MPTQMEHTPGPRHPSAHRISVCANPADPRSKHQARCSCGWLGQWHYVPKVSIAEAEHHYLTESEAWLISFAKARGES